jgi:hypothetical protein
MARPLDTWLLASLALCACAAPSRSLSSEADFVDASAAEYETSFDEVYDAAWLSLEKLGLQVAAHDRRQGTFTAGPQDGVGYDVQATPRETRVRLLLSLRAFKEGQPVLGEVHAGQGELDRVAALHAQVKVLTDVWKHVPELDYSAVKHAVAPDGMRLPLPASWNVLELRTDRRKLKTQLFKRATLGSNPTFVLELDRRRPNWTLTALVQEAAEASVPDARLFIPDVEARDAVMLPGNLPAFTQSFPVEAEPFDLDVLTFTTETHAWALRAAAVCPRPATPENLPDAPCVAAVKRAFAGARRTGSE